MDLVAAVRRARDGPLRAARDGPADGQRRRHEPRGAWWLPRVRAGNRPGNLAPRAAERLSGAINPTGLRHTRPVAHVRGHLSRGECPKPSGRAEARTASTMFAPTSAS